MRESSDERPAWDEGEAAALVGAYVLIGIERLKADGSFQSLEQMHGVVLSATQHHGLEVALSGSREGETYWLPPALNSFFRAAPGQYRLKSTGEVVVDPEFTSTWTVTAAPDG